LNGMDQRILGKNAGTDGEEWGVMVVTGAEGVCGTAGWVGYSLAHGGTPFAVKLPAIAAKRLGWQLYAGSRTEAKGNPADPKVSHAQPPLHRKRAQKKRLRLWWWGAERLLHCGPRRPVTGLTATCEW